MTRPDYCLIDLFNVLYRPSAKITDSNQSETLTFELHAPVVAKKEGLDAHIYWRKVSSILGRPESEFKQINHAQLSALNADWTLFPNRSGWRFSTTYGDIRRVLKLKKGEDIEFKLTAKVYPNGKGESVFTNYNTPYALPIKYIDDSTQHIADFLTRLRQIKLKKAYQPNYVYGYKGF